MRVHGNGTDTAPITLGEYARGSRPELTGDGGRTTVLLRDVNNWTIRDIEVTHRALREGGAVGVLVEATQPGEVIHNIQIVNVEVRDVKGVVGESIENKDTGGIGFFSPRLSTTARFDGLLVSHCTIEHVDSTGIWLDTNPMVDSRDPEWDLFHNSHVSVLGNTISDTGRNAIIIRSTLAPLIAENRIDHSSTRFHGNAVFTRSTKDAVIRDNEVSNTGTASSGENAAFDADVRSQGTVIEYNWSHDNKGGLFNLCNNPGKGDYTDGTIVRFNISENDGSRVFGFSGPITNSLIYNNTVFLGKGSSSNIIEFRSVTKPPHYSDRTEFYNNLIIDEGQGNYVYAGATDVVIRSNCILGNRREGKPEDPTEVIIDPGFRLESMPAVKRKNLVVYQPGVSACATTAVPIPPDVRQDFLGNFVGDSPFRGAIKPK